MDNTASRPIPVAGNTATGLLKLIALALMFTDHAGKMLFPGVLEMRYVGRLAFPLYCWCMVVGFSRTRSVPKYLLRMLAVGIVSQPLYMLALNHTWQEPNVFLTLFLSLCGLWGLREKKWLSHIWAPVLVLFLAQVLKCDYGWQGVLLVLLLYGARGSRAAIGAVMVAFCLYWGETTGAINFLFGYRVSLTGVWQALLQPWLRMQSLAILALPLMLIRFPRDIRLPAWVSYGLYPAHLIVLYVLEVLW